MKKKLRVNLVGLNVGGNIPLGLAYLKAYAVGIPGLRNKIEITISDYDILASPEYVLNGIMAEDPALVGFNVMHGSLGTVLKVSRYLKGLKPYTKIICGGVEITPIAAEVLKKNPFIDMIVLGEGEETFAEILETIIEGEEPGRIAGTISGHEGQLVINPPREPLDMDAIPSPYLTGAINPSAYPAVHIETFRGCPYSCDYCNEGRGFKKIRTFSLDRIREELKFIMKTECRTVKFFDTTFNFDRRRTFDILKFIAENNFKKINFGAEVRMELFDGKMADMALKANMTDIETGLQSLRLATLVNNGRCNDLHKFEEHVKEAVNRGLKVLVHVMGGLPGDTLSDVYEAYDYVLSLGAIPCLFHTKVLPGTKLYERACREGYIFDSEPPYDMVHNNTFDITQFHSYNNFGMALVVITPYMPLIRCLAWNLSIPPSELVRQVGKHLKVLDDWERIICRYRWWSAVIDPAFIAYIRNNSQKWEMTLNSLVEGFKTTLSNHDYNVITSFKDYIATVEKVRKIEPVPDFNPSYEVKEEDFLYLSPSQHLVEFKFNIQPLIKNPVSHIHAVEEETVHFLIVRSIKGTLTKVINQEMKTLLNIFSEGAILNNAIEKLTRRKITDLGADIRNFFKDAVENLVKDGVLLTHENINKRSEPLFANPKL